MFICKYHGSKCETPDRCTETHPYKYADDGHLELIEPERLIIGCVLRMANGEYSSAFSDSVVTGISVTYKKNGESKEKWCESLDEALTVAHPVDGYIQVNLARPYLYANNIGGGLPGWLQGVENYKAEGKKLLSLYKVVVMSTGEYSNYNVRK